MLLKLLRNIVLSAMLVSVSGCLDVQLFGSVAGAQFTVVPILDRDNVVFEATTTDRDWSVLTYGDENWDGWGPLIQQIMLGLYFTDKNTPLDAETLYLVSTSGGFDEDAADRNQLLDAVGTPVGGIIHSIMTGAQIKGKNGRVTVLTELLYQAMFIETGSIDGHDRQWFVDELDKFSDRFVGDLNEDGVVNYADVLEWSQAFTAEDYIGDRSLLDQYIQLVIDGQSTDEELFNLAVTVMDSGINTEHELAGAWTLQVAVGTLECSDGSVTELPAFRENITVSISGSEISFPANDWSAVPEWDITSDSGISGNFTDPTFLATQTLIGDSTVNDLLVDQTINVTYSGEFDGNTWSGVYEYSFTITDFDFDCESSQDFIGTRLN